MRYCDLTSSSAKSVSDIVISCRVKRLMLDNNETIGEIEQFYSMLSHPSTELEILSMYQTKLSSEAASILFTTLELNNALKILSIEDNNITDDVCPFIANAVKLNSCLAKLWMRFNPISAEAVELILQALSFNKTLEILRLPAYPDDTVKKINLIQNAINKARQMCGCQVKLLIDFSTTIDPLYCDISSYSIRTQT